jgi:diguanylate cyclase (GGDEF)-like protein
MKNRPLIFIAVMLLLVVSNSGHGSTAVVNEISGEIDLSPYIELLEDPSGVYDIDDVSTETLAAQFHTAETSNFGFSNSAYWVRLTLKNTGPDPIPVQIRQDYPLIDYLDFWNQDKTGRWQVRETGDRRSFQQREIEHRDFIFPVTVPAYTETQYFLRFASDGALNIGLTLYSKHVLTNAISREQLIYGAYYGGLIALVLYNFLIFIIVRDRAFLYYLLYVISYGLYMSIHNGLAFQFLWPDSPRWGNTALIVTLALSLIWALQFTRVFLDSKTHTPRLDRSAFILQILTLVCLAVAPIFSYRSTIVPIAVLTALVSPLILAMGSGSLIKGYKPARFFMLAWTVLLVGVAIYMFKTFGLLPHNVLTQNGFQIGAWLEMVLLSFALASRVNELQQLSLTDSLTTLSNRRFFDRQISLVFEKAIANSEPLSLLMIDVDHFKQFNDNFGHQKGDEVLRQVAERLLRESRKGDMVCRYGGEEFAFILKQTGENEAKELAERLRYSIGNEPIGGENLTVSIGIASVENTKFRNPVEFCKAADAALYTAKAQGRNRTTRFSSEMEKRVSA